MELRAVYRERLASEMFAKSLTLSFRKDEHEYRGDVSVNAFSHAKSKHNAAQHHHDGFARLRARVRLPHGPCYMYSTYMLATAAHKYLDAGGLVEALHRKHPTRSLLLQSSRFRVEPVGA